MNRGQDYRLRLGNKLNLSLFIARRYFFSKRVSGVVHLISGISLAGITICSFALIVILSVFNGFEDTVKNLYNVFDSDLKVTPLKGKYFQLSDRQINDIKKIQYVVAVTPVIEEHILLKYNDKQTIATFKAIDPPYLHTMGMDSMMTSGDPIIRNGEFNYTLVGAGVAAKLGLHGRDDFNPIQVYAPKNGDINVLNPESAFMKRNIAASGKFSILQEVDDNYIILPLSFARTLEDQAKLMTSFEIKTKDEKYVDGIKTRVANIIGTSFKVADRYEQQSTIFKVMKSEKFFVYLTLTFIMIIAAFNMIGALLMLAIDKKQDMMSLLSMGATQDMLSSIIFYEGLMLSLIGGITGIILGGITGVLQQRFGFLKINGGESSTFVLNAYPVSFQSMDFVLVLVTVIVLGLVASYFPSKIANKRLSIHDLRG